MFQFRLFTSFSLLFLIEYETFTFSPKEYSSLSAEIEISIPDTSDCSAALTFTVEILSDIKKHIIVNNNKLAIFFIHNSPCNIF